MKTTLLKNFRGRTLKVRTLMHYIMHYKRYTQLRESFSGGIVTIISTNRKENCKRFITEVYFALYKCLFGVVTCKRNVVSFSVKYIIGLSLMDELKVII